MQAQRDHHLIGTAQVIALTGIGSARLAMLVRNGLFPARTSHGLWEKEDVLRWRRDHVPDDAHKLKGGKK